MDSKTLWHGVLNRGWLLSLSRARSNKIPCSTLFEPALPPLPPAPATDLARVLVGTSHFCLCPQATMWLLRDVANGGVANGDVANGGGVNEQAQVEMHKRAHLQDMLSQLRRRLRRLASSKESEALDHAETEVGRATAQRSKLATSATEVVPLAARRAASDFGIRVRAHKRERS